MQKKLFILVFFLAFMVVAVSFLIYILQDSKNILQNDTISDSLTVEENFTIEEAFSFQKDKLLSYISESDSQNSSVKIAINNVKNLLQISQSGFFPVEIPQSLARDVLFLYIDSEEDCKNLSGSDVFSKMDIQEECMNELYFKKSLQTKGDFILPIDFQFNTDVAQFIQSQTCNIEQNYICMLLFDDTYISREEWRKIAGEYMQQNSIDIYNLPIESYGYFLFLDDLSELSWEKVADIYYDKALFVKSVYESDSGLCQSIQSAGYKQYCEDFYDTSKKEYYRNFLQEFFAIFRRGVEY